MVCEEAREALSLMAFPSSHATLLSRATVPGIGEKPEQGILLGAVFNVRDFRSALNP